MMEKWLFLEHLAWTVSDDERFCSLWSTTYCVCLYNCLRNTKIRTRRRSPTPWKTKGSLKIVCAVFWLWSLTCSSFSDESENEREKKLIKSWAQIKNKSTASHFSANPPKNINHISSSAQSVMMTKVHRFWCRQQQVPGNVPFIRSIGCWELRRFSLNRGFGRLCWTTRHTGGWL